MRDQILICILMMVDILTGGQNDAPEPGNDLWPIIVNEKEATADTNTRRL